MNELFNARRQGPIGMAEEKDLADVAAETAPPTMPAPIPPQLMPSDGSLRPSMRRPGEWLREHGVTPPPGSFVDDEGRDWLNDWDALVAQRQRR